MWCFPNPPWKSQTGYFFGNCLLERWWHLDKIRGQFNGQFRIGSMMVRGNGIYGSYSMFWGFYYMLIILIWWIPLQKSKKKGHILAALLVLLAVCLISTNQPTLTWLVLQTLEFSIRTKPQRVQIWHPTFPPPRSPRASGTDAAYNLSALMVPSFMRVWYKLDIVCT